MATDPGKFLSVDDVSGLSSEVDAIDVSAGATDAGKIPKTNPDGFIDESFINLQPNDQLEVTLSNDQTLSGTFQTVVFDNTKISGAPTFSYSTGTGHLQANTAGTFMVIAEVTTDKITGGSRTQSEFKLQIDTGSGFTDVVDSFAQNYNREVIEGATTGTSTIFWSPAVGEQLRVQARIVNGNQLVAKGENCRLLVYSLNGVSGPQGPAGSIGAAGPVGAIQYSDGVGGLDADPNFTWTGSLFLARLNDVGQTESRYQPSFFRYSTTGTQYRQLWEQTDGLPFYFQVGEIASNFVYSEDGFFTIRRSSSADMRNGTLSGATLIQLEQSGQFTWNPGQADFDFVIQGQGKTAASYNAGTDAWLIDGSSLTLQSPVDGARLTSQPTGSQALAIATTQYADTVSALPGAAGEVLYSDGAGEALADPNFLWDGATLNVTGGATATNVPALRLQSGESSAELMYGYNSSGGLIYELNAAGDNAFFALRNSGGTRIFAVSASSTDTQVFRRITKLSVGAADRIDFTNADHRLWFYCDNQNMLAMENQGTQARVTLNQDAADQDFNINGIAKTAVTYDAGLDEFAYFSPIRIESALLSTFQFNPSLIIGNNSADPEIYGIQAIFGESSSLSNFVTVNPGINADVKFNEINANFAITGNIDDYRGIDAGFQLRSSAFGTQRTADQVHGIKLYLRTAGLAANRVSALDIFNELESGGGYQVTADTLSGIHVVMNNRSGSSSNHTFTNEYGVFINDPQTGANTWSLFAQGRGQFNKVLIRRSIRGTVVTTSTSESIDVEDAVIIEQTATDITTTLTGAVTGSQITIKNATDGSTVIGATVEGIVNPILLPGDGVRLYFNGTEFKAI